MSKNIPKFPKISKNIQKFPKISKNFQKFPKMSKICKNVQKCNTVKASLLWKCIFKQFVTFLDVSAYYGHFWTFLDILIGMYTKIIFGTFWSHFVKLVAYTQKRIYHILKLSSIILGRRLCFYGHQLHFLNILLHFWTFFDIFGHCGHISV